MENLEKKAINKKEKMNKADLVLVLTVSLFIWGGKNDRRPT
jgi:hypothetical protein